MAMISLNQFKKNWHDALLYLKQSNYFEWLKSYLTVGLVTACAASLLTPTLLFFFHYQERWSYKAIFILALIMLLINITTTIFTSLTSALIALCFFRYVPVLAIIIQIGLVTILFANNIYQTSAIKTYTWLFFITIFSFIVAIGLTYWLLKLVIKKTKQRIDQPCIQN